MHRHFILLFIVFAAGCGRTDVPVELRFEARYSGERVTCGTSPLTDLRFYVSDIELLSAAGEVVESRFASIPPWQNGIVALIDLEDGSGNCLNGTVPTNNAVSLHAGDEQIAGVRFTVGVPFEANHANPLTADAPLDDSDMHWHWRTGYRFLRAGISRSENASWIHLGSTGCEGTVGDIKRCTAPNRVVVEFSDFDPASQRIVFDLSRLFDVELMRSAGERTDCSSGPAEAACGPPFAALGLDFAEMDADSPQQVFSASP